jgi:hypothetical protein
LSGQYIEKVIPLNFKYTKNVVAELVLGSGSKISADWEVFLKGKELVILPDLKS